MAKKGFKVTRPGGVGIGERYFVAGVYYEEQFEGKDLDWFKALKKSGDLVEDVPTEDGDAAGGGSATARIDSLTADLKAANARADNAEAELKAERAKVEKKAPGRPRKGEEAAAAGTDAPAEGASTQDTTQPGAAVTGLPGVIGPG